MNKYICTEVCAAIKKFTTMTKFISEEAFSEKMLGFCLDTAGLSVKKLQLLALEKKWTPEQFSLELTGLIQKRVELAPAVYKLMVIALSDKRSHLVKCIRNELQGERKQQEGFVVFVCDVVCLAFPHCFVPFLFNHAK